MRHRAALRPDGSRADHDDQTNPPSLILPGESIGETSEWPRCSRCLEVCDPMRMQGKSPASWRCNTCNAKMGQLRRLFGAWPIPDWEMMCKEDEAEFWKHAKTELKGKLKELVVTSLATVQVKSESSNFTSEWLPLTVWGQRGFDVKMIKDTAGPKDKKEHPRMGWLYKLTLEHDLVSSAKQKIYQKLMQVEGAPAGLKRKRKTAPAAEAPAAESDQEPKSDHVESGSESKKSKR